MGKLGRGHESDLRINDISVSRCHAKIKLEKGKFMLEDNTSKFGTLVLVKQRTPLLPLYNKAVQVGRTVINFSVKAQHTGSSGMVAEGTSSKYGIKEKRKESEPESSVSITEMGGNQPMVSSGDAENQAMNNSNAFAALSGSANQNDQMQVNDESDQLPQVNIPAFQPPLQPQQTQWVRINLHRLETLNK